MTLARTLFTLSQTSSATASTTTYGGANAVQNGLSRFDQFTFDADITGPTGGVMDVYLQHRVDASVDVWHDWVALPQISAGASKKYTWTAAPVNSSIGDVGGGTTASAPPTLTANTNIGGHPGDTIRIVTKTGSGVTVGGTVTLYCNAFERK